MSLYICTVDGWVGDDKNTLEDVVEAQLALELCELNDKEARELESQHGAPSTSAPRRRFLADLAGTKRLRKHRSRSSLGPSPQSSTRQVVKARTLASETTTPTDSDTSLNDSFTNTAASETSPCW